MYTLPDIESIYENMDKSNCNEEWVQASVLADSAAMWSVMRVSMVFRVILRYLRRELACRSIHLIYNAQ